MPIIGDDDEEETEHPTEPTEPGQGNEELPVVEQPRDENAITYPRDVIVEVDLPHPDGITLTQEHAYFIMR